MPEHMRARRYLCRGATAVKKYCVQNPKDTSFFKTTDHVKTL